LAARRFGWRPLIAAAAALLAAALIVVPLLKGPAPQTEGDGPIGGPFTLVDQDGRTVTQDDLLGRFALIYFGYTFCPDVCPTSLQTMALAYGDLPVGVRDKVQMVFITVDPERDTPAAMKDYVALFDPTMIRLTGTSAQTAAAAEAWGVYFARHQDDKSAADYLVDHSSIVYLMGPDGKYVAHFSHGTSAAAMAQGIARAVPR
jgi:cytochrome oxidase Cu insertion factor (SCO1/SenC/PrrC family)